MESKTPAMTTIYHGVPIDRFSISAGDRLGSSQYIIASDVDRRASTVAAVLTEWT